MQRTRLLPPNDQIQEAEHPGAQQLMVDVVNTIVQPGNTPPPVTPIPEQTGKPQMPLALLANPGTPVGNGRFVVIHAERKKTAPKAAAQTRRLRKRIRHGILFG